MPDEEKLAEKPKLWVWAVVVPVLYVLSYPIFFWAAKFLGPTINTFMLLIFYAPLHWFAGLLGLG